DFMKQLQQQLEKRLDGGLSQVVQTSERMLTYTVHKKYLIEAVTFMKENSARFITLVGSDERERELGFGLYYVFAVDVVNRFVTIKTNIDETNQTFPSITEIFPNSNWYEREIHDLLGLQPEGHPELIPLILHADWPKNKYPLQKDYPLTKMQQAEE